MSLLLSDIDVDHTNWYQAKDFLRKSFRGREIVDYVENKLATDSNKSKYILDSNHYLFAHF
jgi:hypothetical protein